MQEDVYEEGLPTGHLPQFFFNCSGWFLPQYQHQRLQI